MGRAPLLAILLVLALPASAFAGSVSLVVTPREFTPEVTLLYTAAPGERNQVVVGREFGVGTNAVVLHDAGAPVVAGSGCTAIDEHGVRCAAALSFFPSGDSTQPVPTIDIEAGDGDDAVVAAPATVQIVADGGAGNDQLTGSGTLSGGPGNDVLSGGDAGSLDKGSDYSGETLIGGPGDDVLRGGGGFDTLIGDDGPDATGFDSGGGNDVLDGGPGSDSAPYVRRTSVHVDLAAGTADAAGGEHDRLIGIENVTGGDGDDVLLGNDERNRLDGGHGDDTIDGRGGNDLLGFDTQRNLDHDTIRGGDGDDQLVSGGRNYRLFGGAGDDRFSSATGLVLTAPVIRCGSGRDVIRGEPRGQLLSDCELIDFADTSAGQTTTRAVPVKRRGGRLRLDANCFGPSAAVSCNIQMSLRVGDSAPSRRSLVIHNPGKAGLSVRPHRLPRHGDVLRIALTGGLDYGARGHSTWKPRWRVRL